MTALGAELPVQGAAIQQVLPPFATFAAAPGSTVGRQGPGQWYRPVHDHAWGM